MQKVGLTMLGIAAVVAIVYSCKTLFTDADVPLTLKIALGVGGLGLVLLLVSIGVKRCKDSKDDKFKGVER
ncbi:MAG: hypothetical protein J7L90_03890 [Dehalococcoidia bacterium]|nr:hypothetical protein [Dehalococcoidia bacterium]